MTLLFGLAGVTVERVELLADAATRWVHVQTAAPEAACPSCGVVSASVKENTTTGPRDLPYGGRRCRCAGTSGGGAAGSRGASARRSGRLDLPGPTQEAA